MLKIFIVEDKDIVQLYANENHKGMILKKAQATFMKTQFNLAM